jgi:hypothetical protein
MLIYFRSILYIEKYKIATQQASVIHMNFANEWKLLTMNSPLDGTQPTLPTVSLTTLQTKETVQFQT